MRRRECWSCATRDEPLKFAQYPARHLVCQACWNEATLKRLPSLEDARRTVITRAKYRAQLRVRQQSAQGDLVDAVVPCP